MYRCGRGRPLVSLPETHLVAQDLVYLTETKGTWPRPERFGRDDEADGPLG